MPSTAASAPKMVVKVVTRASSELVRIAREPHELAAGARDHVHHHLRR